MTTMDLRKLNLGELRMPGLQRTPVQPRSQRGMLIGIGGSLLLAGLGYLAFRLAERSPSSKHRRMKSQNVQTRRPVAVKAATISPQAPISTNGELAQSERN